MKSITFEEDSTVLGGKRTVCISSGTASDDLTGFTEEFIRPLLLAIGYSPENVNELFAEE